MLCNECKQLLSTNKGRLIYHKVLKLKTYLGWLCKQCIISGNIKILEENKKNAKLLLKFRKHSIDYENVLKLVQIDRKQYDFLIRNFRYSS